MRLKPFALLMAAVVAAPAARADDLAFIVYHQGRLLKGDDSPATDVSKITVALYATETADAAIWSEEYPITVSTSGLYSVGLGDTRGSKKPLAPADLDGDRWISVTVGGSELKPRVRLGSTPYALVASDARKLGGFAAADYAKKAELDSFRTAVTGTTGGTKIQWDALTGIPEDFGAGLRQVAVTGASLSGDGTGSNAIRVVDGGIDTAQLKNGAVTAAKLAPGAVTPDVFQAGSLSPEKLTACGEGQILKFQSGKWQCGVDTGSGGTLTFNVLAPLEQIPGSNGGSATVAVKDGGIETVKIANDAVDANKLKADPGSLGKMTGNALSATGSGSVGVGIGAPTARLEVADFPAAGLAGSGTVAYTANATSITLSGAKFSDQLRVGDSIQLGGLGWKTVTAVADDSVTIDSGYTSGYGGTWSYRRATLRLGNITQTATGLVGIGTASPLAALDVNGTIRSKNPWFSATATDCWRSSSNGGGAYEVGWNRISGGNEGNWFNTSNGRFYAPVRGLYLFTANFYHHSNSGAQASYIHYNIGVNGSSNGGGGQGPSGTYTIIAGNTNNYSGGYNVSRMLFLNAGDYVSAWVHVSGNGNYMCGYHSLFQGALLFQQ